MSIYNLNITVCKYGRLKIRGYIHHEDIKFEITNTPTREEVLLALETMDDCMVLNYGNMFITSSHGHISLMSNFGDFRSISLEHMMSILSISMGNYPQEEKIMKSFNEKGKCFGDNFTFDGEILKRFTFKK
jgi:hypothetical protein